MSAECKYPTCSGTPYKVGYCNAHYIRSRKGTDMERPIVRRGDDPQRFWEKVDRSGDCWEWTAFRDKAGYGRFMIKGIPRLAHRVSYERMVGPIPQGMEVDHICHNTACVNPGHLRPATRSSNGQNMAAARVDSRSGVRGVHPTAEGGWQAVATVDKKRFVLGTFRTLEEASHVISDWRRLNMPYSEMDKKKEVA